MDITNISNSISAEDAYKNTINVLKKNLENFLSKIYDEIKNVSNYGEFSFEISRELCRGFDFDIPEAKKILEDQGYCVYRSYYNSMSGDYIWCIAWDKEEHEDCEEDHSLDYTR